MKRVFATSASVLGAIVLMSCSTHVKAPASEPAAGAPESSLWEQPPDLRSRDLLNGPWGPQSAPLAGAVYTVVERKHSGVNPGMTVRDRQGREWSVKQTPPGSLDREGPVEVVLSRLLSAVGYHQPPVYYLPAFTVKDAWGTHTELGGRFRLKDSSFKEIGSWSWRENPFIGTRPYEGLLTLLMVFNDSDLKDSNNSLYEYHHGNRVEQRYVVRDIGAALGDWNPIAPRKADYQAFERHPLLIGVTAGHVDFAYDGFYEPLVRDRISPRDVSWACNLIGGLNDLQFADAFRAGGFAPEEAERFIRKLREKIAQGRAVVNLSGDGPSF